MADTDFNNIQKRGRKPLTPEQRIDRAEKKRQRERERYYKFCKKKQQKKAVAQKIAGGLQMDKEQISAGISSLSAKKRGNGDWEGVLHHVADERALGRVAALVEHRSDLNPIFPDADRRAVYKRLIAIGLVEIADYADENGKALKLNELSSVARQAAQMMRDGDEIRVEPPTQKMQLEAIKLLGQILAMKDIASLTAEMVAEKMVVAVQDAGRLPGANAIIDAEVTAQQHDISSIPNQAEGYEDL